VKDRSLRLSESLGHPHTASTDLTGQTQDSDLKKAGHVLLL